MFKRPEYLSDATWLLFFVTFATEVAVPRHFATRSHVGGNRARPPRGGAEGVAEEPPTRFRRQAGDVGRRDGQPHDLALHNPRQARD